MEVWQQADRDESERLAVLTGSADRAFCASANLRLTIPLISGARRYSKAANKTLYPSDVLPIMNLFSTSLLHVSYLAHVGAR